MLRGYDSRGFGVFAEERGARVGVVLRAQSHPGEPRVALPGGTGRPLAEVYLRFPDPFISLAAVATATTRVRLGTGLCLLTQRDPITTAKEVATLDVLSGGRVRLRGRGRLEPRGDEEPRHRPGAPVRRPVRACRRDRDDLGASASFHGRFVDFDPIWSYPKPVHPRPPILLGGDGPKAPARALAHGDGWITNHAQNDPLLIQERIRALRAENDATRPEFDITLFAAPLDPAVLSGYAEAGVTRVVFALRPTPHDDPELDRLDRALAAVAEATA